MSREGQRGQSLIELVIAIAVGVLFITGALGIIVVSLRVNLQNTGSQSATELTQELLEQVTVFANADWHNLDLAPAATGTPLYLVPSGGFFTLATGTEAIVLTGDTNQYSRSFALYDVYRDASNNIGDENDTYDPSTLRVVSSVTWTESGDVASLVAEKYVARIRNRQFLQTDWSGGPGEDTPVLTTTLFSTSTNIHYATSGQITITDLEVSGGGGPVSNIDSVFRYAWSDVYGWLDFKVTETVVVSSTKLMGYANSDQIGFIALDCATTPSSTPNICGTSNFGVANDGSGDLKGMAWNDQVGWIRFDCEDYPAGIGDTCGVVNYGVSIDANGFFNGWAWNDAAGWISFNCNNTFIGNTCGSSNYKVKTAWGTPPASGILTSSPFDTERAQGAAFNWIMWRGVQPTDTTVRFQIATSDSDTGPWNYIGPDGTSGTYYEPSGKDTPIAINKAYHHNDRYFRYQATPVSDPGHLLTPTVEDVIVNWSL